MDREDLGGDTPRRIAEVYGQVEAENYLKQAETDYKKRRRKLELSGDLEPADDEDLDWCNRNKIKPIKYISEAEYEDLMKASQVPVTIPRPLNKKKPSKENLTASPLISKTKDQPISSSTSKTKQTTENVNSSTKKATGKISKKK